MFLFQLLSFLVFVGQGSYQKGVGADFYLGMTQSALSKAICEITDAIVDHILPNWVCFPNTEYQLDHIKQSFNDKFNFRGIIGAIDCTHVAIIAPATNDPIRPGIAYYNRKGYYSLNIQMICNSNMKIINCNARFPGSAHDSGIWTMSNIKQYLQQKYMLGELHNSWLLGDSGYPLQPWLLTPIDNAMDGTPEGKYTQAHILARNTIERCFGVLKQRFRCLLKHRTLHYNPVRAAKIIYCCVVLHNMCINARLELQEDENITIVQDLNIQGIENQEQNIPEQNEEPAEERRIKNLIVRYNFAN